MSRARVLKLSTLYFLISSAPLPLVNMWWVGELAPFAPVRLPKLMPASWLLALLGFVWFRARPTRSLRVWSCVLILVAPLDDALSLTPYVQDGLTLY